MSFFEVKRLIPYEQAVILLRKLAETLAPLPNVIEVNTNHHITLTLMVCLFMAFI